MIRPLSEDNILNGFLGLGIGTGACCVHSAHQSGIVVLPGTVHPLWVGGEGNSAGWERTGGRQQESGGLRRGWKGSTERSWEDP